MGEIRLAMRHLKAEDAAALAGLESKVFADAWDAGTFADLLGQDRFVAVGAFDERGLRAYITAYSLAGEFELVNVAVEECFREKGLGGALLAFFLRWANRDGDARVVLEVRSGNSAARALYARSGFVQKGARARYYDNGDDALILEWTA